MVVPPWLGLSLELGVALMLIALGAFNLRHASSLVPHPASPGLEAHGHAVPTFRCLAVGVMHGLAGSAAVALLVLSTIRQT